MEKIDNNTIINKVPFLISGIARTCILAGENIEVVFGQLSKKYELTSREEAEIIKEIGLQGQDLKRVSL
jgi:hypothetical protein